MNRVVWTYGMGLALSLIATAAHAKNVTYVLAIGNNAPPTHTDSTPALAPLRYADDDAASVHEWASTFATEVRLLSVLDTETQQRYPRLAAHTVTPTLEQLRVMVQHFRSLIAQAHMAGDTTNFIFYMSSHGSLASPDRPASLALLDGDLTQDVLYNEVLGQLPADHVHLLVDACHAEAVIRPRGGGDTDVSATVVDLSAEDTRRWLESNTLARFPNVGAIIATASDEESHEWSVYQGGVFTHQLLSGLRGAADVNGDRRIEYSEMHAFLGAANRSIDDTRARLHVVTRPPPSDQRMPLADLGEAHGVGWLVDLSSSLQRFFIEDGRGIRYVDAHAEPGVSMRVVLPANNTYYVHTAAEETSVLVESGRSISMRQLAMAPSAVAARDATVSAMSRGLFATPFGPAYYRGFVDNAGEISVDFITMQLPGEEQHRFSPAVRYTPWILTGASVVAGGVLGGLMYQSYHDYTSTTLQKAGAEARANYDNERTGLFVTIGTAAASAIAGTVITILDHQKPDDEAKPAQ